MKPISIILSINIALLAIWGLVFTQVVDRPEYIPLFAAFQAALNLLGSGIFLLDRKKPIMYAFLVGAILVGALAGLGFYLLIEYGGNIRVEEGFTT